MIKLLSASVLAIVLAASAMAQTSGSGAGDGTSATTGTTGTGATTGTGNGTIDPNATNSTNTTKSNGANDRCKDAAGNDIDNNTATGNTTSNMQNCNK
ncbi:MAG: hypothetical protein EOQ50_04475 [Mesorhizobium sp.]|uniref:hypothetical protein n=1 Tax=Mesorhizobium sp. TaxID=1871066 RepID=UPI000FE84CDA|nr:hypothetical protein [Mesorhizobium sp.]RWB79068.1 MAG: hypothetical protein EOQ50_04475 [Mesorhizobium sp.]